DKPACGEGRNHERGRRAALKDRRGAKTRHESLQPSAKSPRQDSPDLAAERALNAALHHVNAPEQQGDRAGKIEKSQSSVHRLAHPSSGGPPSDVRPAQAIDSYRGRRDAGAVTAITSRKQEGGPKAAL